MAAPRKYSVELKERATRMAVEARKDPATRPGALKRIGDQLGVHPEALRTWVKQAEIDGGVRPGTTTSEAERIAQLERENRELRRANTILKQASAFFASRRSTAHSADRGVRRHSSWRTRSRSDLRGLARYGRPDRSVHGASPSEFSPSRGATGGP